MDYFKNNSFEFIDLFSGIGGFHQALANIGGKCVLASEIDQYAIDTYKENYGIDSAFDITKIDAHKIPKYDVLCGGFPCQTFSKAGRQLGFADQTKGTLFFEIARLIDAAHPKFIILENVRNLVGHDDGHTWKVIMDTLTDLGYVLTDTPLIMSPHQLGIPQLRERVYILGVHNSLGINHLNIDIPPRNKGTFDIYNSGIIEENPDPKYKISDYETNVLTCWDEFYHGIKEKVIGFPIWSFEFMQTYDISGFVNWKQSICRKNRELYINNKDFIDSWLKKWNNLQDFTPTHRKFEWQAGTTISSLWEGFIQFRPSGIRVKRPDFFPALVAMVQIPIIGKYKRRLTPREAARLQSFPDTFIPNKDDYQAYKQFGNAVNVNCVEYLAKQLFDIDKHDKGKWDSQKQKDLIEEL
ncbi:MAG: DNA cytosine methyltransferase [Bacilli bacterium]|nr:DNA cytosine methyltransferase [Bacilli bacterium]